MARTDVNTKIQIIDQLLQTKWVSYNDIINAIGSRINEEISIKTVQNYFHRIKKSVGVPRRPYESLEYNEVKDEYEIIKEKTEGVKYFKYLKPGFKLFEDRLGAKITENLIPFLEYLQELNGLDSNFEETIETLEDLIEKEGFTIKDRANTIRIDKRIIYNLNNVQAMSEFLPICRNAIVKKNVVELSYQAEFDLVNTIIIHPYKIVEYNNRWYCIGRLGTVKEKESLFHKNDRIGKLNNFPFDRILEIKTVSNLDYIDTEVLIDDILDNTIGVSVNWENPIIEEVVLNLKPKLTPYFLTKPLHTHQRNDGNIFTYNLCITKELDNMILSYGSSITVKKPDSLRKRIAQKITEMEKNY